MGFDVSDAFFFNVCWNLASLIFLNINGLAKIRVGHFDQKIKVNQIASYCAMLYPRCCSL